MMRNLFTIDPEPREVPRCESCRCGMDPEGIEDGETLCEECWEANRQAAKNGWQDGADERGYEEAA